MLVFSSLILGYSQIPYFLMIFTFMTDDDCGGERASLEEWVGFLIKVFLLFLL